MARERDSARRGEMYERMLAYREKHAGWVVFRSVYWAIYVFALGAFLLFASKSNIGSAAGQFNWVGFLGFAFVLLSAFVAIYGLVGALHLKLMRKHG
jgi:ABC-type multidrug transport system permease subunit